MYTYEDIDKYLWENANTSKRAEYQQKIPEIVNLLNTGKMYDLAEASQWNNLSQFQNRQTKGEVNLASMANSLTSIGRTTPITQDVINRNMAGLANLSPEDMAFVKSGLEKKFLTGVQPTIAPLGPNAYGGAAGFAAANPTAPPISPVSGAPKIPEAFGLSVRKPFYRVQGSDTVYNSKTGVAYATPQDFFNAGGATDWSNVEVTTQKPTAYIPSVTSEKLQGGTPIDLSGTGGQGISSSASVSAGTKETIQHIEEFIAPKTAEQTQYDELTKQMMDVLGETKGQAATLASELTKPGGYDEINRQLTTVKNDLKKLEAEKQAALLDAEGKSVTMATISGEQKRIINTYDQQILIKTATANALMGNMEMALNDANRAVQIKYGPALEKLDILQKQLAILEPSLNAAEKRQSDALNLYYNAQKTDLTAQMANEKDINATILNLMQTYPDAGWTTMPKTVIEANQLITKNSKIYQEKVRPPQYATAGGATGGKTTGVMAGGAGEKTDIELIAQAIINGNQPPEVKGLYSRGAAVKAELERQGFDYTQANQDWTAMQKRIATMNSTQQVRLQQAINFTYDSLDIIEQLNNQWQAGNFPLLNKAQLIAAKNGVLGQDAQRIATQLDAQINDLVSELGTVYKGGNTSTDESLKLAAGNLKSEWSQATLQSAVNLARTNLQIRKNSIANSLSIEGNQYSEPPIIETQTNNALSTPAVSNQQGFFSGVWNWLFGE